MVFSYKLDEKPYCLRHRYRKMLSEGASIGSMVLKIEARDADVNPKLRYYLTGHGAEHFSLDIDTGNFCFLFNNYFLFFMNNLLLINTVSSIKTSYIFF